MQIAFIVCGLALQNREVRLHLIPAVLLEDLRRHRSLPVGPRLTPLPLLLLRLYPLAFWSWGGLTLKLEKMELGGKHMEL